MKDSIDFGSMNISTLFRKLLIPTVLGMVFSALFVITDGIFVGKGIGSDALAAVNITAPLFMIAAGIGLMFGVGASVVASIHLSQGKRKVASINITQAIAFSALLILILSALCLYFIEPLARLLGSSDRLLPLAVEYMAWYIPFLIFYEVLNIGMFCIRLDGSPTYAMMCNAVAAILNIILDYIFIFEFGWGIMGAAFATSLGTVVGGLMTLIYLLRFSRTLHLCRIKLSIKSLLLTLRNIGYMIKLGSSAFISEASIACMMFLGNYVFIRHLGEDGVAAFSIACYFFPIIFMVYNAIAQSAQPIISYNYGANNAYRVKKAFRLLLISCLTYSAILWLLAMVVPNMFAAIFTSDPALTEITVWALRIYMGGCLLFGAQIACQQTFIALGNAKTSAFLAMFRKIIVLIPLIYILPMFIEDKVMAVFLAEPIADILAVLTTVTMFVLFFKKLLRNMDEEHVEEAKQQTQLEEKEA